MQHPHDSPEGREDFAAIARLRTIRGFRKRKIGPALWDRSRWRAGQEQTRALLDSVLRGDDSEGVVKARLPHIL